MLPERIAGKGVEIQPDDEIIGACRCGARWTGEAIAHCATCHLTFASVNGFDAHRDRRGEGRCRAPDELRKRGLKPNESGHWRRPRPLDTIPERAS
jgi:hypothetical protein